jgi:hypothetical protein
MFYNELDILELNLNELSDIFKKFIIVEYPCGYDGIPRKQYFKENRERFKKFENQIIYVDDNDSYGGSSGLSLMWNRKGSQKLMNTLRSVCKPDDFVISTDSDVVLKKSIFNGLDLTKIYTFHMKWYLYWFNYVTPNSSFAWTVSAPWHIINAAGCIANMIGYNPPGPETIQEKIKQIGECGWHFAKCGGAEKVRENLLGYPHQDMIHADLIDLTKIQERIDNGWGWEDMSKGTHPSCWKFYYEDYKPEEFPKYLFEHPEIYKKYFCFTKGAKNFGGPTWE